MRRTILFPTILVATLFAVSWGVLFLSAKPARAAFPGHNGKIVFVGATSGYPYSGIYTVNPDGSDLSHLTHDGYDDNPVWSPDGTRIAFERAHADSSRVDIYVMNADGSDKTNLTPGPMNTAQPSWSPSWSPDGKKIAFVSHTGGASPHGNNDIYVMNADGSNKTDITNTPKVNENDPAWSPDGSKIAYWVPLSQEFEQIYTVNPDGSDRTNLTHGLEGLNPSWSPNGKEIVFQSNRHEAIAGDPDYDIYVMKADGSNVRALTHDQNNLGYGNDISPAFSPNGKKIVYTNNPPNINHEYMYMMNADGSGKTRLLIQNEPYLDVYSPDWQPNSPPTIIPRRPSPGSTTTDRTPPIVARVSDLQSNLSKSDLTLRIDGQVVGRRHYSYEQSTDRLRYVPSANLSLGTHEVRVVAVDGGGLATRQSWSFKIVR